MDQLSNGSIRLAPKASQHERERAVYRYNCVYAPDIDELNHIVDNRKPISRRTFTKRVDQTERERIEEMLGYNRSFTITNDWHVSYFKSRTLRGIPVYVLCHSGIEYIFQK
jgi:hypothetical protein